jgi:hypothetical protein
MPRVLRNGTHTAIEVSRTKTHALLIPMSEEGLQIQKIGLEDLDRTWRGTFYEPAKAAIHYMVAVRYIGGTPTALFYLKEILMQYIIDKKGAVLASGNKKEVTQAFGQLDEDTRLNNATIVVSAEDLKHLTIATLVEMYNAMSEPEDQVTEFGNKGQAAEQVWDALEKQYDPKVRARLEKEAEKAAKSAEKEAAKAAKSANKASGDPGTQTTRGNSKMGRMIAALQEGEAMSLEALSEASGYDLQNTRTAVGILRSKKGLDIAYDRTAKLYSLAG